MSPWRTEGSPRQRPFGMGAFFDYGVAVTKRLTAPTLRLTPWRKKSLAAQQSAEDRWDAKQRYSIMREYLPTRGSLAPRALIRGKTQNRGGEARDKEVSAMPAGSGRGDVSQNQVFCDTFS